MDLQVIDNFLESYYFNIIRDTLLYNNQFGWYWNEGVTYDDYEEEFSQFIHLFYDPDVEVNSQWLGIFEVMQSKLQVQEWRRIKANLNTRTIFKRFHGWHSDFPATQGYKAAKTAILYLNTNNGYTKFKKGGKVKCVENRLVIFNSHEYHSGVTCTDQKRKVVVNFNYL